MPCPQTVVSTTCAALGPWWPRWPAPLACTGTVSWTRATGHTTWTAGRTGYSVQRDGWPGAAAATSSPGTGSAVNLLNFLLAPFSFLLSPFSFLLSPFSLLLAPFSLLHHHRSWIPNRCFLSLLLARFALLHILALCSLVLALFSWILDSYSLLLASYSLFLS